jgi:hypothetical protein
VRNGAGKKPRAEISTPMLEHIEEHGGLKRLPAPRRKKTGSDAVGDSSKVLVVWDKTADKYELTFGHRHLEEYCHKIAIEV